jgi:hypothetical protein
LEFGMVVTTNLKAATTLLSQWHGREVRITHFDTLGTDSIAVRGVFLPRYEPDEIGGNDALRLALEPVWWLPNPGFYEDRENFQCLVGSFDSGEVTVCGRFDSHRIERVPDAQLRLRLEAHAAVRRFLP